MGGEEKVKGEQGLKAEGFRREWGGQRKGRRERGRFDGGREQRKGGRGGEGERE